MNENHIGPSFDDFLEDEGILTECTTTAIKRVLAWQLEETMKQENLTKTALAIRMGTGRSAIARLLDPDNTSINLQTMDKAARAIGKRLEINLV